MPPPKLRTYGEIIAAVRLALAQDLPEYRIVGLICKAVGVICRRRYKPEGEKKTADMKAYMRAYNARRIAAGLCTVHGGKSDRPGKPTCTACLERKKKANRSFR